MKKCSKCQILKDFSFFNKDKNKKDGHCNNCRDCSKVISKAWHLANLDKQKESFKKSYLENRELRLLSAKKWRKENAATKREYNRRRKALLKSVRFEPYTDFEVLEKYGTICHLCGIEIDMSAPRWSGKDGWQMGLQIDHVMPISKGGSDTLDNVKPSHGICNLIKNDNVLE